MKNVFLLFYFLVLVSGAVRYEPTWESIDSRPLPSWYDEAKIGIFLHWGVYSVPSYGEWFWYNWANNDPSYVNFMKQNYPPNFTYQEFASDFTAEFFDPADWASLFQQSGAKYVVLTSKHHEGYTLWPSTHSFSWNSKDVGPHRDLVGDLAAAIRLSTDLKFGVYHSLYEWYNPMYLADKQNNFATDLFVQNKVYPGLLEVVNNYQPEIIWSDGEWEAPYTYWKSTEFLAWLYNDSPVKDTVVTNDRWGSGPIICEHGGFYTCMDRYNPGVLQTHKWENAMTLDRYAWSYRRNTVLSDFLTIHELLTTLAQTVSCGGNILINVGPTREGTIIPIFRERLQQLGEWLLINGDAIYKTTPWTYQNDTIGDTWYTSKQSTVYALALNWPEKNIFKSDRLLDLFQTEDVDVTLLGNDEKLQWKIVNNAVEITFPLKSIVKKNEDQQFKSEPIDFKEHVLVHPGEEWFPCNFCHFMCKEKDNLMKHLEMHSTPECHIICNECNFKTMEKHSLLEHLKIHKSKLHACPQCNFKTRLKSSLKIHLQVHNDIRFFCKECNFNTTYKHSLRTHMQLHTGFQYFCNECNYQGTQKRYLEKHMKRHKAVQYVCSECNFKTDNEPTLRSHLEIHKEELKSEPIDSEEHLLMYPDEPFSCNFCQFSCKNKDDFVLHMEMHPTSAYHRIPNKCNFKTVEKDSLGEHLETDKSKRHACHQCDFKTNWRSSLKVHLETHNNEQYFCKECHFKSKNKSVMKAHLKIHNDFRYFCSECNYKATQKCNLHKHVMRHRYSCGECDFKTNKRSFLKSHLDSHEIVKASDRTHLDIHKDGRYVCNECDFKAPDTYTLRTHLEIHKGVQYSCNKCDFKAILECTLRSHYLNTHKYDYQTMQNDNSNVHLENCKQVYNCNKCGFKTDWKLSLENHLQLHRDFR
ncbi:hypothetical protein FQA39_LY06338 [Lamprigera yunnana]|nr:hypothetical protein FQA39_LY06338 [Lamprigera yunnana]